MSDESSGIANLHRAFEGLRAALLRNGGLTLDQRRGALKTLRRTLIDHADDYVKAIDADFRGRSRHETLLTEVAVTLSAIDDTLSHLKRWAAPKPIRLGFPFWPATAELRPQPRGIAGIVSPSNYPLQLTMMPLIGALSAGCRVLVKPSEMTPRTAALIASHLGSAFDASMVAVVTGGEDVAAALTALPLDVLHFTGSSRVGAIVSEAAAKHMTPVVLELGGKSPVIVDISADLDVAAEAIVAGKLINAGQTCVAPDYVYVPHEKKASLIEALRKAAIKLYPRPENGDYSAIASDRALARQHELEKSLDALPLFETKLRPPYHTPKVILSPPADSAVMTEEIFGPLLPVIGYTSIDEAIAHIRALPAALVVYWFGCDNDRLDKVISRTRSGAVSVNETVLHAGINALPFGGIGASGIGRYHGKAGFDTFSIERVIFRQSRWSITRLMRPPYGQTADRILRFLLRK
jgi:acyl-CoA reductase-like NAD-dependent aldehyde dehydrogenase